MAKFARSVQKKTLPVQYVAKTVQNAAKSLHDFKNCRGCCKGCAGSC